MQIDLASGGVQAEKLGRGRAGKGVGLRGRGNGGCGAVDDAFGGGGAGRHVDAQAVCGRIGVDAELAAGQRGVGIAVTGCCRPCGLEGCHAGGRV